MNSKSRPLRMSRREFVASSAAGLTVGSWMAEAALVRTESRGVRGCEDFAGEDQSWRKHVVFQRGSEPRFADL